MVALTKLLNEQQPGPVRVAAALALGSLANSAVTATRQLVDCLPDSDVAVEAAARWAIRQIQGKTPDAEALRSALDSRDPWILVAVAEEFEALALAGKDVPTAGLVRLLSNKAQPVQLAAAPCAIAAGGACTPAIVTARRRRVAR